MALTLQTAPSLRGVMTLRHPAILSRSLLAPTPPRRAHMSLSESPVQCPPAAPWVLTIAVQEKESTASFLNPDKNSTWPRPSTPCRQTAGDRFPKTSSRALTPPRTLLPQESQLPFDARCRGGGPAQTPLTKCMGVRSSDLQESFMALSSPPPLSRPPLPSKKQSSAARQAYKLHCKRVHDELSSLDDSCEPRVIITTSPSTRPSRQPILRRNNIKQEIGATPSAPLASLNKHACRSKKITRSVHFADTIQIVPFDRDDPPTAKPSSYEVLPLASRNYGVFDGVAEQSNSRKVYLRSQQQQTQQLQHLTVVSGSLLRQSSPPHERSDGFQFPLHFRAKDGTRFILEPSSSCDKAPASAVVRGNRQQQQQQLSENTVAHVVSGAIGLLPSPTSKPLPAVRSLAQPRSLPPTLQALSPLSDPTTEKKKLTDKLMDNNQAEKRSKHSAHDVLSFPADVQFSAQRPGVFSKRS